LYSVVLSLLFTTPVCAAHFGGHWPPPSRPLQELPNGPPPPVCRSSPPRNLAVGLLDEICRPSHAAARRRSHPPRAQQGPLPAARGATRKRRQLPRDTCAPPVALPVGGERLPPRGVEGGGMTPGGRPRSPSGHPSPPLLRRPYGTPLSIPSRQHDVSRCCCVLCQGHGKAATADRSSRPGAGRPACQRRRPRRQRRLLANHWCAVARQLAVPRRETQHIRPRFHRKDNEGARRPENIPHRATRK